MKMLDWKPCRVCTSLAEARACRPSLLQMVISRSSMIDEYSSAAAACRGLREFVEGLLRVIEYTKQHGQIETGYAVHVEAECRQALSHVARRRAIEVGQHQHALATVEAARVACRLAQRGIGIGTGGNLDYVQGQRQLAKHMP